MRGDPVADAGGLRILPGLRDKVRIDVERVYGPSAPTHFAISTAV
jgi:hypothetical protein